MSCYLNRELFARVHTSFIVNLAQVKELRQRAPQDENHCLVLGDSNKIIPIARARLEQVRQLLQRI